MDSILVILWEGFSRLFAKLRYPREGEDDGIIESRTMRRLFVGLLVMLGFLILLSLYVVIFLGYD